MNRKGLSKEIVFEAAAELIEEKGLQSFNLHQLAAKLGVKTASLYNHITNLSEVNAGVARIAVKKLTHALNQAVTDKPIGTVLMDFAIAYRNFAHQNPELYKAIINLPSAEDEKEKAIAKAAAEPFFTLLPLGGMSQNEKVHFVRNFRSSLHGFVSLEEAGYLHHDLTSVNDSFKIMIEGQKLLLNLLTFTGLPIF